LWSPYSHERNGQFNIGLIAGDHKGRPYSGQECCRGDSRAHEPSGRIAKESIAAIDEVSTRILTQFIVLHARHSTKMSGKICSGAKIRQEHVESTFFY
jgi:hypothetical protein